jgi:hypothetical protein
MAEYFHFEIHNGREINHEIRNKPVIRNRFSFGISSLLPSRARVCSANSSRQSSAVDSECEPRRADCARGELHPAGRFVFISVDSSSSRGSSETIWDKRHWPLWPDDQPFPAISTFHRVVKRPHCGYKYVAKPTASKCKLWLWT